MKKLLLTASIICSIFILAGCGSDGGSDYESPLPTFTANILSDANFDGDIALTTTNSYTVTQPAGPSLYAGIDPFTYTEYRAFLNFPLGNIPLNASIESAYLDLYINSIETFNGSIPVLIELVAFQPPNLLWSDFDRTFQPVGYTTINPPISAADSGRHVTLNVTALMREAQSLGLPDFQLRIMEDFGIVPPGLIEINDGAIAPLLSIRYY